MFVTVRRDDDPQNCAAYTILAYGLDGNKDILGLWTGDAEGKRRRMQIFDEIKSRGVEDVVFISMDGVSGLEDGACRSSRNASSSAASCTWSGTR